ncbi:MAG: hypothetical protein JOZ41_02590, partial [Chloroflexi bacterium]|nr:hypothetical protein [Chloroflexota bacterium]
VKLLPRLSFTEALERYHIAGPVDLDADRPEWQARAADDVRGTQDD